MMHGISCEPNIDTCIWENEYGHKPCRENRKETMKQNVEILKQDVDKMKKQIQELKHNKAEHKIKIKKGKNR